MSPRSSISGENELTELIRELLIVELGLAGVPQQDIRKIARCDMNRVSRIVRLLKTDSRKEKK